MTPKRDLFLAAYDVSTPGRLRRTLDAIKRYACGGQKSVYECFMTPAERRLLLQEIDSIIDAEEDRFFLIKLDPRCSVVTLGVAVPPADPEYFYVG